MEFENGFEVVEYDEEEEYPIQPPRRPVSGDLFDWIETIAIALIAVVIIFTFFFRIATIVGPSMQNTLYSGERVIISDLFYTPKYGDIIVISRNSDNSVGDSTAGSEPIIKRVIATGGQYVDIDFQKGKVFVGPDLSNMTELNEPYTKTPTNRKWEVDFPVYVEEGYVFVLGDNRNDSLDSRSSSIGKDGLVDERYILGKAIYRIWPFDTIGGLGYDE
ncbi:MAG: signal peptidase I [Acutalibacteraceae bacterium]|nr:signal peptidase I [Acutalibacteraceae bacterium]